MQFIAHIKKMKKNKFIVLRLVFIFFSTYIFAQDELLNNLLKEKKTEHEKIIATFKSTKIIDAQTNETVHAHTLDFRVTHLFGNIGKETEGKSPVHTLYGFDASSDIRISFEYGITNRLTVGFSRSKVKENLEGLAKYRIFYQSTDNHIPVSLTFFVNTAYTPQRDYSQNYKNAAHRFTYVTQGIISRKFSKNISAEILPTYVHRNYIIIPEDENDIFSLGAGARVKVTRSMSIIADYFYNFSQYRINRKTSYFNPLGLGVEFETGGHVFSLMFTNASSIIENEFIPYTTDGWQQGGIKFSFIISRNFSIGKYK